eukprot:scaffold27616_cov64-Phaeocystis_antarctica.AAC.9
MYHVRRPRSSTIPYPVRTLSCGSPVVCLTPMQLPPRRCSAARLLDSGTRRLYIRRPLLALYHVPCSPTAA